MSGTLEVVLDQLIAPVPGGIGRYTRELARALTATAPPDWDVVGVLSLTSASQVREIELEVPGLARIRRAPLERRLLARAWERGLGVGRRRDASLHATSLLAPLRARRLGDAPTVVTVHDVVPWTHPETLTARGASWHRIMAERAAKFADAVVVPTQAVADRLDELLAFGERLHVVPGAVSADLALPADATVRADALALPDRFVLAVGTLEPRKGLGRLIESFGRRATATDAPLLIAGPAGWGGLDVAAMATAAGIPAGAVRVLGRVSEEDLAVLYARATAFVMPSLAEGFGLPIIEAFSHGTPVIHSDDPALVEVAGGAGVTVPIGDGGPAYADRLARAIAAIMDDEPSRDRLGQLGIERARAFDWRASAERVWALHRELA